MTREQMLIDALHDVVSAESWSDAVHAAKRTLAHLASEGEDPQTTRYGVVNAANIAVADSMNDALAIAHKRCLREPGYIVSVVAVQRNFTGKVLVEEIGQ